MKRILIIALALFCASAAFGQDKKVTATTTLNGTIVSPGSPAYTERGFVYDTYDNPTITNTKKVVSGNGTGAFSATVTNLQNYQIYYVRAYAKTSSGSVVYGESVSFETFDW
jgi:hypothetical protein